MEFFRQRQEGPDKHFKILDMTFGSGGHQIKFLESRRKVDRKRCRTRNTQWHSHRYG